MFKRFFIHILMWNLSTLLFLIHSGNVAFKKHSTQTMNDPGHPASCATDGSYATCYARPYTRDGTDARWMVDLGGYYVIQAVVIHSVNLRTPSTPAPAPAPQTSTDGEHDDIYHHTDVYNKVLRDNSQNNDP